MPVGIFRIADHIIDSNIVISSPSVQGFDQFADHTIVMNTFPESGVFSALESIHPSGVHVDSFRTQCRGSGANSSRLRGLSPRLGVADTGRLYTIVRGTRAGTSYTALRTRHEAPALSPRQASDLLRRLRLFVLRDAPAAAVLVRRRSSGDRA